MEKDERANSRSAFPEAPTQHKPPPVTTKTEAKVQTGAEAPFSCATCHEEGHIGQDCPNKKIEKKNEQPTMEEAQDHQMAPYQPGFFGGPNFTYTSQSSQLYKKKFSNNLSKSFMRVTDPMEENQHRYEGVADEDMCYFNEDQSIQKKIDLTQGEEVQIAPQKQTNKILILGLAKGTQQQEVEEYFQQSIKVINVNVKNGGAVVTLQNFEKAVYSKIFFNMKFQNERKRAELYYPSISGCYKCHRKDHESQNCHRLEQLLQEQEKRKVVKKKSVNIKSENAKKNIEEITQKLEEKTKKELTGANQTLEGLKNESSTLKQQFSSNVSQEKPKKSLIESEISHEKMRQSLIQSKDRDFKHPQAQLIEKAMREDDVKEEGKTPRKVTKSKSSRNIPCAKKEEKLFDKDEK